MRKNSRHIFSFIFLLFIVLFSANKMQAETIVTASSKPLVIGAAASRLHTEMEIVKLELTSRCHATIQKKLFIPFVLQAGIATQRELISGDFFSKRSLLFTRDQLVHNYPFHCFW